MSAAGASNRLSLSLALACIAAVVAGWLGDPFLLGAASLAAILLTLAFGWKANLSGAVRWSLIGVFVLFTGVIAWMAALDDPAGELVLWLGFPPATALLIYAVWPLGVLPSLLYALRFRDTVLPLDKLERFLAEHSRHEK